MAGFDKILDIMKQNKQIAEDEEQKALERCEQFRQGKRGLEINCEFCDLKADCDITWRRMGVCR